MKNPRAVTLIFVFVGLVAAGGAGWVSQWQKTMALRVELELARIEVGEWERLRAENQRLRSQQISAAELEVLRADHAALPRLRAEIEALQRKPPAGP